MTQANQDVRERIDKAGLTQWQVAEEVGINHVTMSVWLRTPLNAKRKQRVDEAIKELERKS